MLVQRDYQKVPQRLAKAVLEVTFHSIRETMMNNITPKRCTYRSENTETHIVAKILKNLSEDKAKCLKWVIEKKEPTPK